MTEICLLHIFSFLDCCWLQGRCVLFCLFVKWCHFHFLCNFAPRFVVNHNWDCKLFNQAWSWGAWAELSWAASAVIKPVVWTLNQFLPGGVQADFHGLLCVPASPLALLGQHGGGSGAGQAGCVWPSTAVCVLRTGQGKCSPHLGCVGFTVGKMLFN